MQSGSLLRWLSARFGRKIIDQETGCLLGRAFLVPWGGSILILGYTGMVPLRPIALATKRLDYWRLSIGFSGPRDSEYKKMS